MGKSAEVIDGKGVAGLHWVQRVRKLLIRKGLREYTCPAEYGVSAWRGRMGLTGLKRGIFRRSRLLRREDPAPSKSKIYQQINICQVANKWLGCSRLEWEKSLHDRRLSRDFQVVYLLRDSGMQNAPFLRLSSVRTLGKVGELLESHRYIN